jgi:hypothetical protein
METLFCNMGEYKRKISSLNNRILLLRTDLLYENECIAGIKCKILGSSDRIYTLMVKKIFDKIECTCNCPDFLMRNITCKHIYWLGRNKFGSFSPNTWQVNYYEDFIVESWLHDYDDDLIGRNDNCPICLDEIDHECERTICCKNNCGNSVHSVCWSRYYEVTGNTKCVLCRENTTPFIL